MKNKKREYVSPSFEEIALLSNMIMDDNSPDPDDNDNDFWIGDL